MSCVFIFCPCKPKTCLINLCLISAGQMWVIIVIWCVCGDICLGQQGVSCIWRVSWVMLAIVLCMILFEGLVGSGSLSSAEWLNMLPVEPVTHILSTIIFWWQIKPNCVLSSSENHFCLISEAWLLFTIRVRAVTVAPSPSWPCR